MRTMVRRFVVNKVGRDYAVGDIHGCFSKLEDKLDSIGFNPRVDRLFSVGDLVDRGPESGQVALWLAKPWFHAVMGNHDDMARRWPAGNMQADNYRRNGGGWNIDQPIGQQVAIANAMAGLPVAIEVETAGGLVGIVHADCAYADWPAFIGALDGEHGRSEAKHCADMAMWSRKRMEAHMVGFPVAPVTGVRAVVVGHTPVQEPVMLGNVYHIDTGAVFGRDFTILSLDSLQPVA